MASINVSTDQHASRHAPGGADPINMGLIQDGAVAGFVNTPGSATGAALAAGYVPQWKASTAYVAGQAVVNPSGDVVTAKVNFTSGTTYNATNWNLSASYETGTGLIFYVSTTGNDSHSGKTWAGAFATIGAAVTALGNNAGTIMVSAGSFSINAADTNGNGATLTHQGQKIVGQGANQTTIVINTNVTWGVQLQAQFSQLVGVTVSIASGKTATYGVGVSTPASTGSAEFCRFTDVFVNCAGTVTAAFALGPDWPGSANVDVADTIFDGCCYNGAPTHGYLFGNGTAANVVMQHMISCGGNGAQYGLSLNGSGVTWFGGGFSNNTISDIHIMHGCTDTVLLSGLRCENGKRFLDVGYVGGITGGVTLNDCTVANYTPSDNKIIEYDSYSPLNILGGYYEAGSGTLISVNSSGGTPAVPFIAIGVELVNANGWPAYNPARVIRTILNASYNNAGVSTPHPAFSAVFDGGINRAYVAKTASYSLALTDDIVSFNGTTLTATLPDPTLATVGHPYTVVNLNASALSVVSAGTSKTINGAASQSLGQWSKATYLTDGTQWVAIGDGPTGGTVPTMGEVDSTSNLTLTGTAQDVPGATLTIVPAVAGKLTVTGTFDFSITVSGEMMGGYLNVDGTNQPQQALMAGSLQRAAVTRHWTIPLTAASHTIKLQAARVTGTGTTHATNATHTGFSYQFVPGAN